MKELASITFNADGTVTLTTGTLDFGMGHATPFAQVLSDQLGVPVEKIKLVQGDSDLIPEMDDLRPEIALLPVSGTYVMTVDEAVDATSRIKPKIAIPMHYGSIVGSEDDARKFKSMVKGVDVRILASE